MSHGREVPSIAFFVSPHGFGHAARAAAIMAALRRRRPEIGLEIFTTVPRWFFADSLAEPFGWHSFRTDVGLVQKTSIDEDPAATADALEGFFADLSRCSREAAARLEKHGCALAVADISVLGIAAAHALGLPSMLVENFTWDWIYGAYLDSEPRLAELAERFAGLFGRATLRVQPEPVCRPLAGAIPAPPVSRRPRRDRAETLQALGLPAERPLVLLTMGGVSWSFSRLERLRRHSDLSFAAVGGVPELQRRGNLVRLPDRSPVFVPDLVAAADVVVGKLGYSTVAEAFHAGARYAWVDRPRFPESPVLARFVAERLPSVEVAREDFLAGRWVDAVTALLGRARPVTATENGDDRVAGELLRLLAPTPPNDGR